MKVGFEKYQGAHKNMNVISCSFLLQYIMTYHFSKYCIYFNLEG